MSSPRKHFETVDEYIQSFPSEVQRILEEIRRIIREAAPESVESISYQIPTAKLNGKYVIYFSAFKNHVSLYPRTLGLDAFFADELLPHASGKGTMQFPLDRSVPYDLVKRIVEFRVRESHEKKK